MLMLLLTPKPPLTLALSPATGGEGTGFVELGFDSRVSRSFRFDGRMFHAGRTHNAQKRNDAFATSSLAPGCGGEGGEGGATLDNRVRALRRVCGLQDKSRPLINRHFRVTKPGFPDKLAG
jgi:hypothetical protein